METNNIPAIRIAGSHRSCNCCYAQNCRSQLDHAETRHVDVIYEVVVSHMVNALCPDCLRALMEQSAVILNGKGPYAPGKEDLIHIQVRDCNGKRDELIFRSHADVLEWAEDVMTEEDEILVITRGTTCLYSALQTDKMLTAEEITGFFA